MLICLLNLQILAQNDIFLDFSLFWRSFCNHSNYSIEINTQSKHFDHSTNKTSRRNCCTVTFIFWLLKGGGQKTGLTHVPLLPMVPLVVANGTIGNKRTLNVSRKPMVPLVPMFPLVDTLVPFGKPNGVNSNIMINTSNLFLYYYFYVYISVYNLLISSR